MKRSIIILSYTKSIVTLDDLNLLGGLVDPLEYDSYEISSPDIISRDTVKGKEKSDIDSSGWIKIKKPEIVALIVEAYVDQDKKKILNALSDKPKTIPQLFSLFNFESTHGYRKIHSLIKSGLIKPVGFVPAQNRKKIKKYLAVIEDVHIQVTKDIENVVVRFKKISSPVSSG